MNDWPVDYDPKDFKTLHIPRISEKSLIEIGRFMVMWGILEGELDILLTAVFRLDSTLSLTITAGLNTKAKIEILRSAIDQLREPLGKLVAKQADDVLIKVAEMSGTRTVLAHGQLTTLGDRPRSLSTRLIRYNARKQLTVTEYPVSPRAWKTQSNHVKRLARAVRQLVPLVVESVRGLSAADYDRLSVTR